MLDVKVIDCDVHPYPRSPQDLLRFAPGRWAAQLKNTRVHRADYIAPAGGRRLDAYPSGGVPGSDPELMNSQLLRDAGVDFAILVELLSAPLPDRDLNAALRHTLNAWLVHTWLEDYNSHSRFRGSISVPVDNPPMARREIAEWAAHPHMIQVLVPQAARAPYGQPQYHPIWAEAARRKLPVAIHTGYGGGTDSPTTPVGFLEHYLEFKSSTYPLSHAAHLVSLICEGVFDMFEDLTFVFLEGGFSWVGPVVWRLEQNWNYLKSEVPQMKRRPIEYLRTNIRFTTQPIEEPEHFRDLVTIFDLVDAHEVLMFATDYPHYDYDDPVRAIDRLPAAMKTRILGENARQLYGLPDRRQHSHLDD